MAAMRALTLVRKLRSEPTRKLVKANHTSNLPEMLREVFIVKITIVAKVELQSETIEAIATAKS